MYHIILNKLKQREEPIDVIMAGLGFMGFGFLSAIQQTKGFRIPLVISRRPEESKRKLENSNYPADLTDDPDRIDHNVKKGVISLSDDLTLIERIHSDALLEVTGTVVYGTEIALATIAAKKHLITMNPELQVSVGSKLKELADTQGVILTDVIGDQPGSLSRLIGQARLMGFRVLLAGNMKRYLNRHATTDEMKQWALNKGLSVKQTVSFTDGTKQSIEMTLVANYFGLDILQFGMRGLEVSRIEEILNIFPWSRIPPEGIADYAIGRTLFPGVFLVVEHTDIHQQKYLSYLGLGEGPRYVLFEPYHLCHLEVAGTIAKVVLFRTETIHNTTSPKTTTIAVAKQALLPGTVIDGIGGNTVYGNIDRIEAAKEYIPVGLIEGARVKRTLHQDEPIKMADVEMPANPATRLMAICDSGSSHPLLR